MDDIARMNSVSQNTCLNIESELVSPKDILTACAHGHVLENIHFLIFFFLMIRGSALPRSVETQSRRQKNCQPEDTRWP